MGFSQLPQSQRWTMNIHDWKRLGKNALIFLAPVGVVELQLFQNGASTHEYLIALKVWVIGILIDFFRKLQSNG